MLYDRSMKWLVGLVVLLIIGGAAYFVFKPTVHAPTPAPQMAEPTVTVQPTMGESSQSAAMEKITVTATDFAFTPSTLTLKKGDEVSITFKNNGKYPHNFTISELGVGTKTIQPGQEDTLTFTPSKSGSFTFLCTVPGHADRGMTGTLTVE